MKNIVLVVFAASLFGCASQKKLEVNDVPFKMGKSTIQQWAGGREESGSGADLKIEVSETLKGVNFEKVYFRERVLECTIKTEGDQTYIISSYKTEAQSQQTPNVEGKKMQETFDIKPTEAVLEYTGDDGKSHYVKVTGIKEKTPRIFPGRSKN